jgi:hypothetical protein
MNPAVTNLVISLGAMQLAKRVPFDDPNVLMIVRIGYVLSQALCIGVYLYISAKVGYSSPFGAFPLTRRISLILNRSRKRTIRQS